MPHKIIARKILYYFLSVLEVIAMSEEKNRKNRKDRKATTLDKKAWRRFKILNSRNERTVESMLDEAAFDWLKKQPVKTTDIA